MLGLSGTSSCDVFVYLCICIFVFACLTHGNIIFDLKRVFLKLCNWRKLETSSQIVVNLAETFCRSTFYGQAHCTFFIEYFYVFKIKPLSEQCMFLTSRILGVL